VYQINCLNLRYIPFYFPFFYDKHLCEPHFANFYFELKYEHFLMFLDFLVYEKKISRRNTYNFDHVSYLNLFLRNLFIFSISKKLNIFLKQIFLFLKYSFTFQNIYNFDCR